VNIYHGKLNKVRDSRPAPASFGSPSLCRPVFLKASPGKSKRITPDQSDFPGLTFGTNSCKSFIKNHLQIMKLVFRSAFVTLVTFLFRSQSNSPAMNHLGQIAEFASLPESLPVGGPLLNPNLTVRHDAVER
jgi:hypothetical protein